MTTRFQLTRDNAGLNSFGVPFSTNKYGGRLISGNEQTLDIPAEYAKYLAIFSYTPGDDVWVALDETASAPAGSTEVAITVSTSELNPVAREIKGGSVLHFITNNEKAEYGVVLYAL